MGFSLGNSALGPGAICENEVFVGVRLGRGVVLAQLGLVVFRAVFVGRSGGMLASAIDGFGFLGLVGFILRRGVPSKYEGDQFGYDSSPIRSKDTIPPRRIR